MELNFSIVLVCLFILFFLKVPIFVALLLSSLLYFFINPDLNILFWAQRFISGMESIPLLAIPFFIMTGISMNYTGITKRLMVFCELLTQHHVGGLANVNILLSTLLGGISGSSLADAAMQSKMLVPEMEKRGYPRVYSAVITAFSSIITPIIPPGIALILFGYIGNVSIGRLFLAGIIPGILLCGILMMVSTFICKKNNYQPATEKKAGLLEVLVAAKTASMAILIPIFIIVGIRVGIFTPSEIGAVTVTLSLFIGILFYKEIKLSDIKKILIETVYTTSNIMLIIASASLFSWILTWEGIPQLLSTNILTVIDSPLMFLIAVNIFLLIAGTFIEGNALLLILVPILMPVVYALKIDPVHFGIIIIVNLAIGSLTPPVGTITSTVCTLCNIRLWDFLKEAKIFYIMLFVVLLIITYIPQISVFLPNLIFN